MSILFAYIIYLYLPTTPMTNKARLQTASSTNLYRKYSGHFAPEIVPSVDVLGEFSILGIIVVDLNNNLVSVTVVAKR